MHQFEQVAALLRIGQHGVQRVEEAVAWGLDLIVLPQKTVRRPRGRANARQVPGDVVGGLAQRVAGDVDIVFVETQFGSLPTKLI